MSNLANKTRDRNKAVTTALSTREIHAGDTLEFMNTRKISDAEIYSVGVGEG